ncbi:SCO family protein [Cohnella panacarvi]|uniref:SCO family protein n=1 Tax=Cohnella panacarvi TaxID=400776 RepID=UPI00047C29A5|nr:SCO family protein [Cohnella panacarvi]
MSPRSKVRPTTVALVVVLLFGAVWFYAGTDGFTAYTTEQARLARLAKTQPSFPPDVTLEDSRGSSYSISEFAGRYVFITFFYSSCPTVCVELERNMEQVYDKLPRSLLDQDIVFLSISFDPDRDDPARLEKYRQFFDSDGEKWRMARVKDQAELDRLLDRFGVIVIPDDSGGFAHNSAFYLVDPAGTLVDVMDYEDADRAAEKVAGYLNKGGAGL